MNDIAEQINSFDKIQKMKKKKKNLRTNLTISHYFKCKETNCCQLLSSANLIIEIAFFSWLKENEFII